MAFEETFKNKGAMLRLAKLKPPQIRQVLERPRLFKKLDRLRNYHRAIWIQGPPGAGKTTLVASYLQIRKLTPLWYQLDEGDADPGTLFHYLILGVKQIAPRYKTPLPHLRPEYRAGMAVFTRRFFEQVYQRLKIPGIVVFDNYQEVSDSAELQNLIRGGLSVIPEGVTVVIISRHHPPAILASLQVGQHLV